MTDLQARAEAAADAVERMSRELDITNADHIALWLEANMADSTLGWLACRIIEAHEQALALHALQSEGPLPIGEAPRDGTEIGVDKRAVQCLRCAISDFRGRPLPDLAAVRNEALEEAAKVAFAYQQNILEPHDWFIATYTAGLIRAIQQKGPSNG